MVHHYIIHHYIMSNAAPAPPAAAGVKPPSVYTKCIRLQPHVPCSKYGGLAPSMVWRYLPSRSSEATLKKCPIDTM